VLCREIKPEERHNGSGRGRRRFPQEGFKGANRGSDSKDAGPIKG